MAASSHYGYGSSSRYLEAFQPEQDNDRHMYANFSWQNSLQSVSSGPGLYSDVWQRSSQRFQRQIPAGYYREPSAAVYGNQQPFQVSWPPASGGYQTAWSYPLGLPPFASRPSVQQSDQQAIPPAPHPGQHQTTANTVTSPTNTLTSSLAAENTQADECVAPPNAPPCASGVHRAAPVAHILNDPQPPVQTSLAWPIAPGSTVVNVSHTSTALGPYAGTSSPDTVSNTQWSEIRESEGVSGSPQYVLRDSESDYVVVQGSTGNRPFAPSQTSPSVPAGALCGWYAPPARDNSIQRRRRLPRQKLPTVPSSALRRQAKSAESISRRKGELPASTKANAAIMRKSGKTCIRCRFYKRKCNLADGDGDCQSCLAVVAKARVWHSPCFRGSLLDTCLDRRCHGRFDQSEAEFRPYSFRPGASCYAVRIVWHLPGYGAIGGMRPLPLTLQEYCNEGGTCDTEWSNTQGRIIRVQHYPLAAWDTEALQNIVREYFRTVLPPLQEWIHCRNPHDELAIQVCNELLRIRRNLAAGREHVLPGPMTPKASGDGLLLELIENVLTFMILSIVRQGYGTVVFDQSPGSEKVDFRRVGCTSYEAYNRDTQQEMLGPAANHQIDVSIHKWSKDIETKIRKGLSTLILQKDKATELKNWYQLFLCLFILLFNLEYMRGTAEDYIASKQGTRFEHQTRERVGKQMEDWDHTHNIIVAHWNAVLRDYRPLELARKNPEELRERGGLPDLQAFKFVLQMVNILDRAAPDRFPPPRPDVGRVPYSLSSRYVMELLKGTGA